MRRERRRAARVVLAGEAIVRCGNQALTCRTGDISATGMVLYPPQPLDSQPIIRARLRLPGEMQWLEANAVFVRDAVETATPHACAVEFLQLPARTEAALKRFTTHRPRYRPFVAALERLYKDAVVEVAASDAEAPLPKLRLASRLRAS